MEEEDEFGDLYADVAGVSLKDDDASSSSPPYSKREEEHEEDGGVGPSDELELFYGQMTITSQNKDCYSNGHHTQTDKGESPRENDENHEELADNAYAQLAQMDANANGNGHNWGNNNTDSDNDSDDLDILVNDDQHQHHRAEQQQEISENGGGGGDDEDDDDDDLVIVTGDEQPPITIADTEWGDEGLQLPLEGEISLSAPPLPPPPTRDDRGTGISALNSHYSQFKYVRRGAAAVSVTVPSSSGVVQNQSKPSVFNGGARGPGRCDWSCSGGRSHIQRSFRSGVGMPPWSGGSMSRMQNGFEFTLPPNKTIFDINVDKFDEKRWRHPGVDVSNFFNFDLDEDSWKDYCRQLEQHRLESTMQRKICVYESGRSEQDYDPDLPPELAAATGLLEALGENIQHRQDTGSLAGTVLARGRPQFPTGRAIQVEGGIGDRLPSVDVRRPRLRDSDAVIQIVLHDATEDDSAAPINAPETVNNRSPETVDNTSQREEPGKASHESEEYQKEFDAGYSLLEIQAAGKWERGTPRVRTCTDGRIVTQNVDDGDGILPLPLGPPVLYQVSTAEPGMYPTEPLGLPPAFRGPQLLVPYKSHLHVEDKCSKGSIANWGKLTLVDSYQKGSALKGIIRKRRPVICSRREQSHKKMHFDMKSESHSRQASELGFQVSKEDDNGFVYYSKRQKLNSQKELPESVANDSHLFNMSESDNCKSESGDSRYSSKYRRDEQEGSIDRQQKKLLSLTERKGPQLEEEIHPSNGYCWNGRGDADKDIISLNARDVLYCHSGRDEVYLYRDPERMDYKKAKEECIDEHRERNGHFKSWQGRDRGVQIQREKIEDVRRRDRLQKVDGSKHRISGQDSGRHEREDHLHPGKRKDADDRKDQYDKEDFGESRGIERHIVERQENEGDSYLRKKKEEEFRERDKVDKDARIRDQTDPGDISRDKLDRDELQFRWKEEESRRMGRYDDSCTRKPNIDTIRRDREDEHWRKSGYEGLYCRRGREDEICLLSERSKRREDKLWHANDRDENNAREEARVMNFDKYKVYDKRRHEEHSRVRDLIDEDGRSKHHEQDDICSWEDRLAYEQRSSRDDHIYLRHEMSCTVHGVEERRLYRGKHILYTVTSKEFHNNDRHGYSSGLADHKLRNDLTISRGRRKPEDYPAVHQDEKVSARCMDVQETGRTWNDHVDHRSHNHKMPDAMSKRLHEQHGAYHDVAKLEKGVSNGCHSEDELRRDHNNIECWAYHKEKMQDRDSSKHWKEVIGFRDDPINTEKPANEEQINLKVKEMAPAMERQHLKEENWDINFQKAVPNELVNATDSKVVSIDQSLNRQHLEAVAKLEKRRERFKQPIIVEKPVNKKAQYETTIQKETTEVKQERPARKRKWSGS